MTQRLIELAQSTEWTAEAVTRAVSALFRIFSNYHTPGEWLRDPEGDELAVELVRWLRYAADADPVHLAAYLEELRLTDERVH